MTRLDGFRGEIPGVGGIQLVSLLASFPLYFMNDITPTRELIL